MDNFDIKRFARTVRWMYRINVKNVLSFAAGLSFGYLFTFIGWLWPLLKSGSAAQEAAVRYSSSLGTCSFISLHDALPISCWSLYSAVFGFSRT